MAPSSVSAEAPAEADDSGPPVLSGHPLADGLRDFMDSDGGTALVSRTRGLAVVVAGPSYNPETGDRTHEHDARHLCGDDARRRAVAMLRDVSSARPTISCDGLSCMQAAEGEWASETSFHFRRAGDGGVELESIVEILDVPMRDPDPDADRAWAKQRRLALRRRSCVH